MSVRINNNDPGIFEFENGYVCDVTINIIKHTAEEIVNKPLFSSHTNEDRKNIGKGYLCDFNTTKNRIIYR